MKMLKVRVREIKKLSQEIYRLSFKSSYLAKKSQPGQFLHLKINSTILRRPFSIHKVENQNIFILFKVKGRGTKILSTYKEGDSLDILGPLGKGFKIYPSASVILIAGGIGIAPLLFLAQRIKKGLRFLFFGTESKKELVALSEFKKLGFKIFVATQDGSEGVKGDVVKLFEREISSLNLSPPVKLYACGSNSMLYNLAQLLKKFPYIEAFASLEQFMGCGVGACLGCVILTKKGYKRVCQDGPVFNLKEIF